MTSNTSQNSQYHTEKKPIEKFVNKIICGDALKTLKPFPMKVLTALSLRRRIGHYAIMG